MKSCYKALFNLKQIYAFFFVVVVKLMLIQDLNLHQIGSQQTKKKQKKLNKLLWGCDYGFLIYAKKKKTM